MMQAGPIITLLTDFGDDDGFVGVMKGVILNINSQAHIIDLTHQIPSHHIEAGAFILSTSYEYFPRGTIHVAIVDPGVGSERKAIGVRAEKYFFIAPDNGILKYIFHRENKTTVVELANSKYFLSQVSNTFHGRDIFAPCAAHLSNGVNIQDLGPQICDYITGSVLQPIYKPGEIEGHIIYSDKFGNLITNIPGSSVSNASFSLTIGDAEMCCLSQAYENGYQGKPFAIIGSSGYLEIAVFRQNAQRILGIKEGDRIVLKIKS